MSESKPPFKDTRGIAHEHPSDGLKTGLSGEGGRLRAVGVVVGLLVLSFVTTAALTTPVVVLTDVPLSSPILNAAVTSSGLLVAGGAYLLLTGRGRAYLDIRPLSLSSKTVSILIGLIISLTAVQMAVSLISPEIISTGGSQSTRSPGTLLIMLLIAPTLVPVAEELFFRNLLQKRLAEAFPAWGAIGLAALLFTAVHIGRVMSSPGGIVTGLVQVFASAVLLGYAYHRTKNLTITIVGHAGFNAIVYTMSYLQAVSLVPSGL